MAKNSIFTLVKNQIRNNLIAEKLESKFFPFKGHNFYLQGKYPQGVIMWLIGNKIFELTKVEKVRGNYGIAYEFHYKNLNFDTEFLKDLKSFTIGKDYSNLHYQDEFRQELDGNYFIEKPYLEREKGFEKIDKEDSCTFELYYKTRGFDSYREYLEYCWNNDISEEEMDRRHAEFLYNETYEYLENV